MAGLNANNQTGTGGGDYVEQEALEVKQYPGRVVQVIDLGLQPQKPYNGKDKPPVDKIHMTYEFSDEFLKDDEGNDREDMPRWLSEDFPFYSLDADKAKSTLRYNAIDPTGVLGGEFTEMVGMPLQILVVKEPKRDRKKNNKPIDGKFVNYVGDISGPVAVKGYEQPALVNPGAVFTLAEPDLEVFNKLPDWLQDRIKGNLNYNGSKLQGMLGEEPVPVQDDVPAGNSEPPAPPAPPAPEAPAPDVPQ